MPNVNTTLTVVAAAGVLTALSFATGMWSGPASTDAVPNVAQGSKPAISAAQAEDANEDQQWAASATGRIEPTSGLVQLVAEEAGQIEKVLASTNDRVFAGDLLVVLDDKIANERVVAARAEVDVRMQEREEEPVSGLAKDREKAADALADAQDAVRAARQEFDSAFSTFKTDNGTEYTVTTARDGYSRAKKKRDEAIEALATVEASLNMPLPTRIESSLAVARADLAISELGLEKTRVRAPFDGTVLNVFVNEGETVSRAVSRPLIAFGDISKLRVRAEVEERDIAKVRVGQKVVIRADAFPDRDFVGTVSDVASALGPPRITSRGPRRPNDVDVLEVVADIDGTPPLLAGMRVDVFFKRLNGDAKK